MKTKQILLLVALMIGFQWCVGQNESKAEKSAKLRGDIVSQSEPYLVLKVDNKTLKIGKGKMASEKLNEIKADWVSTVEVWKDQKAVDLYGEDAKGGVIAITFKDINVLSKEFQDLFNDLKKVE